MSDAQVFSTLNLEALTQACKEETKKYSRGQVSIPDYCFELLCRACRDLDDAALAHVFTIYIPQLASRARRHPLFSQSCEDAALFARTALVNFFNAVRGEKFQQKFFTLAQAIAYMRTCVHSAILEDIRSNSNLSELDDENLPAIPAPSELEQKELLSHIYSLLSSDEQRLFYLRFVLEMKPAEIIQAFPAQGLTAREVSVSLQNIRRRLRANEYLRQIAGLSDGLQDEDSGDG